MLTVGVRRWLIHSDYACPHKDIETKGCVQDLRNVIVGEY